MNLYVSNLSYQMSDSDLQSAFEAFGAVSSARVITDRESGRSRGFGFVEMPNDEEARAAINSLNEQALDGRPIKVVEARPKEERPRREFSGGGGGGGGGQGYRSGGGGGGGYGGDGGGGGGGGGRKWDRDRGERRDRGGKGHRGGDYD